MRPLCGKNLDREDLQPGQQKEADGSPRQGSYRASAEPLWKLCLVASFLILGQRALLIANSQIFR